MGKSSLASLTPLVATCKVAPQNGFIYCTKCNKNLMRVKSGGTTFTSRYCDCSWGCCEHSRTNNDVRGYKCHTSHISFRPETEENKSDCNFVVIEYKPNTERRVLFDGISYESAMEWLNYSQFVAMFERVNGDLVLREPAAVTKDM